MNPTILTPLIAAAALIVGACLTTLVSAYAARQKIKEIELTYLQKIREDYLANARLYTNGVYVPISIALSDLLKQYFEFRTYIDFTNETVDEQYELEFRRACEKYDKEISLLSERGADAFLTAELEESLRSFNSFIKASQTAKEPKLRLVLRHSMGIPIIAPQLTEYSYATEVQGK